MAGTYSQLLLHVVFSTKHRLSWITSDIAEHLYPYIGGIIRSEEGTLSRFSPSRNFHAGIGEFVRRTVC